MNKDVLNMYWHFFLSTSYYSLEKLKDAQFFQHTTAKLIRKYWNGNNKANHQ